jgi:EAL domain-containing protein (putative c-di-GMP-specific phosphodiesterase class I)
MDAKRNSGKLERLNAGAAQASKSGKISKLIDQNQLKAVFQPIVDMMTGKVFAYEALARTTSADFKSPPHMFDTAIEEGMCGKLGRRLRELSVDGCPDAALFLNIHPNEFAERWLVQPDDPIFSHDLAVYLEITESVPLSHFELCNSILKEIRGKGVNLVVDDLGAGYSNLKYIADLTPEVVKLDRGLIAGLSTDARLRKLVSSIVRLCEDLGAAVVAEGIETVEELHAVLEAGVGYGQGYYLARPNFPPPKVEPNLLGPLSGGRRRNTRPPARRTVPPKAMAPRKGQRKLTRS